MIIRVKNTSCFGSLDIDLSKVVAIGQVTVLAPDIYFDVFLPNEVLEIHYETEEQAEEMRKKVYKAWRGDKGDIIEI